MCGSPIFRPCFSKPMKHSKDVKRFSSRISCDSWARPQLRQIWVVGEAAIQKINVMKVTKNIGMLLLAIFLIIYGLLGFGINFGPAVFLLYLIALAAGVFILSGK